MDKHLGLYIHIPFCASKCRYCDFYSQPGTGGMMNKYQRALCQHLEESAGMMAPYYIDTLYFGGGTPSYFGAKRICEVLNTIKKNARLLKSAEITVEANPDSITQRDMKMLLREGVNRLSIGVQSANDDILKLIGRRHNFQQAVKAVKNAREAGFGDISVDLIYGLPTQSRNDWADTLSRVMALRPDHISCYGLKLEEGTPLWSYRDSEIMPNDDDQADMYLYAVETLERYGYNQYEISNFCLDGHESRHNLKYWRLEDYAGFGPAAHSCIDGLRYSYVRSLKGYIDGVMNHDSIIDEYEKIDRLDMACEYIMLGMRTTRGISAEEYHKVYRSDFAPLETMLEKMRRRGWTKCRDGRWCFTPTGFLVSNQLIGILLDAQAEQKLSGNPWVRDEVGQTKR
ncbi:MAG: radical SAM family heme chaperone HemW [Candidatus Heteroscillospira sp.]|jgi:putative oxygen-independent coproporphyrinogen III oxidase